MGFVLPVLLIAAAGTGALAAPAEDSWLTIGGDPTKPGVETVQVQPDSVVVFTHLRAMELRVSRSRERQGYDGLPYRSYIATVHVDCNARGARFRRLQLFTEANWGGQERVIRYGDNEMPPMAFRDMQPNPAQRIIQAACSIETVKNR